MPNELVPIDHPAPSGHVPYDIVPCDYPAPSAHVPTYHLPSDHHVPSCHVPTDHLPSGHHVLSCHVSTDHVLSDYVFPDYDACRLSPSLLCRLLLDDAMFYLRMEQSDLSHWQG